MKIALVHDYLKEYGGAERVLEALHEIWPQAPIFTAFVDWEGLGPHKERLRSWDIKTSWANNWFIKKLHSPLRFLAPWVWESFDFTGFDVVISSSGWFICRGIITPPETLHICYLHHPPRHLYGYATSVEWQKYLPVRVYAQLVNHFLRLYDFAAAQRVDYFIANSKETQRRIAKFYRRESTVIYPPVTLGIGKTVETLGRWPVSRQDSSQEVRHHESGSPSADGHDSSGVEGIGSNKDTARVTRMEFSKVNRRRVGDGSYYLCVSRLARAKHIDLAIEACQQLGVQLKIVGKGRDEGFLKSKVKSRKSKVDFLGEISDEELAKVYDGAKALIFPAEDEEFGIVPVEAMAHGVPVIAYRSGGLKETVVEGKTGNFFDDLTVESLIAAIKHFNDIYHCNNGITTEECLKQAKKFSKERFKREIVAFVKEKWESWQK